VEEIVEMDFDGAGGVAVETEGLLGDLRDAREFGVGGFEQELDGRGDVGVGTGEIDEVGDSLERVIDLVGNGGGEAAGGGELLALALPLVETQVWMPSAESTRYSAL
jgi:phage-related minor tail protein